MPTRFSYYSPFGSCIQELQYAYADAGDTSKYRFEFNNQEQDKELGEYYAFEYRMHDSRLGRFLSVDPLFYSYPWFSCYQFAGNSTILNIDLEGKENDPTQPNTIGNQTEKKPNISQNDNTTNKNPIAKSASIKADYTFKTPDNGNVVLLNCTEITKFETGKDYFINGKKISLTEGSVKSFVFGGVLYSSMFDIRTGKFLYYKGANGSILGYKINTLPDVFKGAGPDPQALGSGLTLVGSTSKNPYLAAVVAAVLTAATWETATNLKDALTIVAPTVGTGGFVLSKTADELIPASLKRSPSYNPNYGDYTVEELAELARKGDIIAGKMKKLAEQGKRLLEKTKSSGKSGKGGKR